MSFNIELYFFSLINQYLFRRVMVLSLTILSRLEKYATDIIGEYQSGFIREKSTANHVFTIRQIMEKYYEYNK